MLHAVAVNNCYAIYKRHAVLEYGVMSFRFYFLKRGDRTGHLVAIMRLPNKMLKTFERLRVSAGTNLTADSSDCNDQDGTGI